MSEAESIGASVQNGVPLLKRPAVVSLLIVAFLAETAYAVLNLSTMPVYLQYDRGLGPSVIGLVIAVFLLSEAVLKSPMGAISVRLGTRWLMILGPAISIGTSFATLALPRGFGGEVVALMGLRALDGLGAAMLWPAAFAYMGDLVEDSERQRAMSLLNMCYLVGVAIGLPVGGIANDLFGQAFAETLGSRSPAILVAAGMFALVTVMAFAKLPKVQDHHVSIQAAETPSISDIRQSLTRIPSVLALAAITYIGVGFPMAIVKLFAEEQLKLSESAFGAITLPIALAMAGLSLPLSRLGERIGRGRAVHWGLGLCAAGVSVIALGAFFPFMRTLGAVAVGALPAAIGFLLTIPAWMASVSDIDARRRGVYLGAVMTAQGVGAILGMAVGSAMYEKFQPIGRTIGLGPDFGRYMPFVGCAGCLILGWVMSMTLLRKHW